MPVYMKGNMWDHLGDIDHFIITTNATIKQNGALVMGRGIAQQVRDSHSGIDVTCGSVVTAHCQEREGTYGLILNAEGKLGLFQVKYHFGDTANINLIRYSANMLEIHARQHDDLRYALNFPGIGNGKLKFDKVLPYLRHLPSNVHIWTFK